MMLHSANLYRGVIAKYIYYTPGSQPGPHRHWALGNAAGGEAEGRGLCGSASSGSWRVMK